MNGLSGYLNQRRFDEGGQVSEAGGIDANELAAAQQSAAQHKKAAAASQQTGYLAANANLASERDSRARAFYEKKLADLAQKENSFGARWGLDEILARYGAPPGEQAATLRAYQEEMAGRDAARKEATAGLAALDLEKAQVSARTQFNQLMTQARELEAKGDKVGAAAVRDQAVSLDPSQYKAQAEARKLETQAVSNFGKQAQDEGLVRGTPEFTKRVSQLQQQDFNLKQQQANVALQRLNLAVSKESTKPLNPTEQKEVNRLTDNFQSASRNIEEAMRLKGVVKDAGFWQTGLLGSATAWTGFGKAAEIEAQLAGLAPKQRPPGAGATSDYDAKQYLKAVGGGLSKENLQKTIDVAIAFNKHDADYNMFIATAKENRVPTTEAARIWREYANANPIFTEKGAVNLNRPTIAQWIDAGRPKPAPGGASAKPPAIPPAPGQFTIREKNS